MSKDHAETQDIYAKIGEFCHEKDYESALKLLRRSEGDLRLYLPHEKLHLLLEQFSDKKFDTSLYFTYLNGVIFEEQIAEVFKCYSLLSNNLTAHSTWPFEWGKTEPYFGQAQETQWALENSENPQQADIHLMIDCHLALAFHCQRQNNYRGLLECLHAGLTWLPESMLQERYNDSLSNQEKLHWALEVLYSYQAHYERLEHHRGRFDTVLLQGWLFIRLGDCNQAESRLQSLNAQYSEYHISEQAIAEFYRAQTCLHWLSGRMEQASSLGFVCRLKAVMHDNHPLRRRSQILLANIYREQGKYEDSDRWYRGTRKMNYSKGYFQVGHGIDIEVEIHAAWQHVLLDDLSPARKLIGKCQAAIQSGALCTDVHLSEQTGAYSATADMLDIVQSILYILDNDFVAAQYSLQRCQKAARVSLSSTNYHTLQLYQAYLCLQDTNREATEEQATDYLYECLGWFAEMEIDYLPEWWHPTIIPTTLAYAIEQAIYPEVAKRLIDYRNNPKRRYS